MSRRDNDPGEGNWEVSGIESHKIIRWLLDETATQTVDEMAMEFADSGVDVLTRGEEGSCPNEGCPEYKDWG